MNNPLPKPIHPQGLKMMFDKIFFQVALIIFCSWIGHKSLHAQTPPSPNGEWTLEQSVAYARAHNLTVVTNTLNERLAKLTYQQSQLSQIPNLNANTAYGRSFGRSIDPTTNQFTRGSYDFISASAVSDVLLFGWFQKRNTIAANRLMWEASKEDLNQLADDIALNVANAFLRAVLAQEQIKVNRKQLELSSAQLLQTRKFVETGRLPELNQLQLESQLAMDSANYINAQASYNSAILDIKALLNLDFITEYVPVLPQIPNDLATEEIWLSPESVFLQAKQHMALMRGNQLKLAAARKTIQAAKGGLWPQLGLGAQLGSNWASTYQEVRGATITGTQATGAYINTGTQIYEVYQPTFDLDYANVPLGKQLDQNFRQTISINLSIPIFNAWQAQASIRRAKIDLLRQQLTVSQSELNLRSDVYRAHNDLRAAYQKYQSAQNAVRAANKAFEMAQKRYELGLTNTVEYLTTQNAQYNAESQLQSARYDFLFRLKVIEYYLGKPIKI